jgi:hypothetical protein
MRESAIDPFAAKSKDSWSNQHCNNEKLVFEAARLITLIIIRLEGPVVSAAVAMASAYSPVLRLEMTFP